jgi:hypothetical protein
MFSSEPVFSKCCHNGKVYLYPLLYPPEPLFMLLTNNTSEAKHFRMKIQQYNSVLAFTSFTSKERNNNNDGFGPWIWKTRYTIYHCAGTLFPDTHATPTFAQLYFYDADNALQWHMNNNKGLN